MNTGPEQRACANSRVQRTRRGGWLTARVGAILVVAVGLLGDVQGQPVPSPVTAPPRFAVISAVDQAEATVALLETRSIVVYAGQEPRVIVDVSATRLSLKTCRAWTAAGKEIPRDEIAKHLKPGQTVLVSPHGQKPDPAFTRVLKEGTVILVDALK